MRKTITLSAIEQSIPVEPHGAFGAVSVGLAQGANRSISLSGRWDLAYGDGSAGRDWPVIPATVPGNVELDLMAAGVIADPAVGMGAEALRAFEHFQWRFSQRFGSPDVGDGERVELVFEGVDTLATYWLNGVRIGESANMLIAHALDVTDLLRRDGGENELVVHIEPTALAARRRVVEPGEFAMTGLHYESLGIRKAPHMFGWDIMPRVISAGLWREVRLEIRGPTRFRHVYAATTSVDVERRSATLLVDWDFSTADARVEGLSIRVTLSDGGRTVGERAIRAVGTHDRVTLALSDIELWWPRGAGAARLYDLVVQLAERDGTILDEYRLRVGLRTVELRRTALTTPEGAGEFVFVVNGRKIFARGTNWVPLDALHSRDREHLASAFAMLVDLNCNMVRCWGGNVYEDHAFFDLCDEHGIMVWQDFAMGCAVYPQDDGFAAQIRVEAESVVQKLRNHPSLVLWAGNNEGDEAYAWAGMGVDPNIDDRITRQVLPAVVRRLDPLRPYLPSSPYRAAEFFAQDRPATEVQPEQHLWGPRDDFKGAYYTTSAAHFASEIGYHGCPDRRSLEQMMDSGFVWPWQENPQWLAKAVKPHPAVTQYDYRIPLMASQIKLLFDQIPDGLDDFVLASQISQAEALKFFIEHFRQGKWRRTGILWWNLRDGWPIISDAIVDYYGRRKLAYHYVRRVQADVCVMVAEPSPDGRYTVMAVNDTPHAVTGEGRIHDLDQGRSLFAGTFELPANGDARCIGRIDPIASEPALWQIEWSITGRPTIHGRNHYLAGPRPFDLPTYRRWLRGGILPIDQDSP